MPAPWPPRPRSRSCSRRTVSWPRRPQSCAPSSSTPRSGARRRGAKAAEAIGREGEAQADAITARGEAEAEGLRAQAEAYKQFNDAAVLSKVLEALPTGAGELVAPYANIKDLSIVSTDGE